MNLWLTINNIVNILQRNEKHKQYPQIKKSNLSILFFEQILRKLRDESNELTERRLIRLHLFYLCLKHEHYLKKFLWTPEHVCRVWQLAEPSTFVLLWRWCYDFIRTNYKREIFNVQSVTEKQSKFMPGQKTIIWLLLCWSKFWSVFTKNLQGKFSWNIRNEYFDFLN